MVKLIEILKRRLQKKKRTEKDEKCKIKEEKKYKN